MKLIVAGLGRTGTQSIVAALQQLGLRTFSQEDLVADLDVCDALCAMARGERDFEPEVVAGYDATVGWPLCYLHAAQAAEWPEAKVLLNVRDADAWYDSVARAWPVLQALRPMARFHRRVGAMMQLPALLEARMGGPPDRARWTAGYRAWTEEVRQATAPDRLRVYEVTDGWGPICELLELPVPGSDFPRGNSSKDGGFQAKVRRLLRPGAGT